MESAFATVLRYERYTQPHTHTTITIYPLSTAKARSQSTTTTSDRQSVFVKHDNKTYSSAQAIYYHFIVHSFYVVFLYRVLCVTQIVSFNFIPSWSIVFVLNFKSFDFKSVNNPSIVSTTLNEIYGKKILFPTIQNRLWFFRGFYCCCGRCYCCHFHSIHSQLVQ